MKTEKLLNEKEKHLYTYIRTYYVCSVNFIKFKN